MLARPHFKKLVAPPTTPTLVPRTSAPAIASVATFRITGGALAVSPLLGAWIEMGFDSEDAPPTDVGEPGREPLSRSVTVDVLERLASPEHETLVRAVHFTTYDVDFLNTSYEVEVSLSPRDDLSPGRVGSLRESGSPSVYTIEQAFCLQVVIFTVLRDADAPEPDCQRLAVACAFDVPVSLTGTYVGTINPTVGTAVVQGGGVLVPRGELPGDELLSRLFADRPVKVNRLVLTSP